MLIIGFLTVFAMISKANLERILVFIINSIISFYIIKRKNILINNYKKNIIYILLGYLIATLVVFHLSYPIREISLQQLYSPNDRTSIILVFDEKIASYDIGISAKNFRQNNTIWKAPLLPFKLIKEKYNYEKLEVETVFNHSAYIAKNMEIILREEMKVKLAYIKNSPYLGEVINETINEGYEKIIISPIMIGESNDFLNIKKIAQNINSEQYYVKIINTYPIWDSESVARYFVQEIETHSFNYQKHNVGIVLIGEKAKPKEQNPQYIKQDILFRHKIKDILIQDGYNQNKIKLSYLNQKDIMHEVEKIMEYGVGLIVLAPITLNENLDQYSEIEKVINRVDKPSSVQIQKLHIWRVNNYLIAEIKKRVKVINIHNN